MFQMFFFTLSTKLTEKSCSVYLEKEKNIWLLILESTEKEKREGTVDKSFSKKVKFLCFSYIDQLHG